MYTSGWPKIQKKCCQSTAEPPAWVSKKCAPRNRSSSSMICAADNGGSASMIIADDDEHHPNKQRHAHERHAFAAQADDRSTMTLMAEADAADAADEQAENPVVRAIAA